MADRILTDKEVEAYFISDEVLMGTPDFSTTVLEMLIAANMMSLQS